jgi:hypothetical protein
MIDKVDNPTNQPDQQHDTPEDPGGTVALDGTSYQITPTAFRAHYQVMTDQGTLLGLIEAVETSAGRTFTARPATGAGMTQSLMMKIADAAAAAGIIK